MKRLITFLGIVVLIGAIAVPLSARGWRGMGYGPDLCGDPRMGDFPIRAGFGPLTEEQRTQLDELHGKFQEETAEFREALSSKFRELNTALTSEKLEEKKAKDLQKEISDLQARLAEKRLDFRLEAAKIIPESDFGKGFARGMGIEPRRGGFSAKSGLSPLTEEQRTQLTELSKKFREETAQGREKLRSKSRELNTVLNSEDPDKKKAKDLQKEISALQADLSQKTLDFRFEVCKVLPESECAEGYGRGFGPHRGRGPHVGRGRALGGIPRF